MICEYKAIIKGKKNACYAFMGSMPAFEGVAVYVEKGSDAEYYIRIGSECKYKGMLTVILGMVLSLYRFRMIRMRHMMPVRESIASERFETGQKCLW